MLSFTALIKPAATQSTKPLHESIEIFSVEKARLEQELLPYLQKGWLVKARTHDAEGRHGVVLVK